MRSRPLWLLALSLVLTLTVGVTAYATREHHTPPTPVPPAPRAKPLEKGPEYVAIGDSFTAGGPIGKLQLGGEACLRSRNDYPSQVAKRLGLSLTDVSCGGASTRDALAGSSQGVPPQVEAVSDNAKLVTISIGGNDSSIYVAAFINCLQLAKVNRTGSPCENRYGAAFASRLQAVEQAVADVIAKVQERAPKARIMAVNYPRLLPDDADCSALPYPDGDIAWITQVERNLSRVLREAGTSRGVEVVDIHAESEGHDVCSTEPWVNGLRPEKGDGWFLHPNAAGAKAVADAIIEAWREGQPARR